MSTPPQVLAHAGEPVAPHDLLTAWPLDPAVLVPLVALAVVYWRGVRRLWAGEAGRRALPGWRVGCFAGAVATTTLALLSPVEALAGTLVSAHMGQHLLLTMVLAPLLVLSRPVMVAAMALPAGARRAAWRLAAPVVTTTRRALVWSAVAVIAHLGTMWLWHAPSLYRAALASEVVHGLEHVTLLAGAALLWWLVADARGRNANALSVLAVLVAALGSAWLAGLITFAPTPWLGRLVDGARLWGLTAPEDQQLAGGLMWFPGALAYVIGGSAAFLRWLRLDERQARSRDRTGRPAAPGRLPDDGRLPS